MIPVSSATRIVQGTIVPGSKHQITPRARSGIAKDNRASADSFSVSTEMIRLPPS